MVPYTSALIEGFDAAASGCDQVFPSCDAAHVNHARRACGSYIVSYQHAQSVPVLGSTVAVGTNCCVFPWSGGFTCTRKSFFPVWRSMPTANTSLVWFWLKSE